LPSVGFSQPFNGCYCFSAGNSGQRLSISVLPSIFAATLAHEIEGEQRCLWPPSITNPFQPLRLERDITQIVGMSLRETQGRRVFGDLKNSVIVRRGFLALVRLFRGGGSVR
jgi:hypothetical protein